MKITKKEYDKFNTDLLKLGNINNKPIQIDSVCAIFDLANFTEFTSQNDIYLILPEFMNKYLNWLFERIKSAHTFNDTNKEYIVLSSPFPIFSKFMGDGVLFLWNAEKIDDIEINNIISICYSICLRYYDFYDENKNLIPNMPAKLRCGIARGNIFSIGNKNDYIGPCINMASRLQKLKSLNFAVNQKGFNINLLKDETRKNLFISKSVYIRGFLNKENVYIVKEQYNELDDKEKKEFIDL